MLPFCVPLAENRSDHRGCLVDGGFAKELFLPECQMANMRCCIETGFYLRYVSKMLLCDLSRFSILITAGLGKRSLTPSQPIKMRHNAAPSDEERD